jgi:arsenate reductase
VNDLLARSKALGDPTRLKLLRLLMERECAVHELVDVLATGQSRVSQHLARLKRAGLVQERRAGRQTYYAANAEALLGLDQLLMTFLYTPMDQLPEMRKEWPRWCQLPAYAEGAYESGAVPIEFAPKVAARSGAAWPGVHRILFLCTANSFRSQIAEAWARTLGGPYAEVQSAGLEPSRINPVAVEIMREVGVELTGQYSKAVTPQILAEADVIVTLCGTAMGWFPLSNRSGVIRQHWPFSDPTLTAAGEAAWQESRLVRDGIRRRVEALLASLHQAS